MALKSHTSPAHTIIVADKSPAMRRALCAVAKEHGHGRLAAREASTIHAIVVLLRQFEPALILAGEEIGGGDAHLLAGMIRDAGYCGRLVLLAAAPAPRGGPRRADAAGPLDIVARRDAAAFLAELLRADTAMRPAPAKAAGAVDGETVVPFRIEERRIIETAIRRCGGNIGKAARALEISPSTIYRKIHLWHGDAAH